jgi:hypothetical protein
MITKISNLNKKFVEPTSVSIEGEEHRQVIYSRTQSLITIYDSQKEDLSTMVGRGLRKLILKKFISE